MCPRISVSAWSKTRVTIWSDNNRSELGGSHDVGVGGLLLEELADEPASKV